MPWTPSSGLQHMADISDQVNRQKSAAVTIAPMMRVTHQHVVDRDGAKLECAYQCRCGPLLLLSDNAERCDALCRVAKVMSCRIIVGITHDRHEPGQSTSIAGIYRSLPSIVNACFTKPGAVYCPPGWRGMKLEWFRVCVTEVR